MQTLLRAMTEFLEEMQSLVEADDGDVFLIQHIEMMEDLEQLLKEAKDGQ